MLLLFGWKLVFSSALTDTEYVCICVCNVKYVSKVQETHYCVVLLIRFCLSFSCSFCFKLKYDLTDVLHWLELSVNYVF